MKKHIRTALLALTFGVAGIAFSLGVQADNEHAGREDAVHMVKKGAADIKANGISVYTEISNPKGKYVDRDLYLVVYDMTGRCLAHGQNPALVGKDLSNLKDVDGKPFVQERITLAKTQANFWQDYKYMNPTSHAIAPKQSYCEAVGDVVVCGGVYK